uniref:Uncharacterized protein n=1 Tax=Ananas comosus var. bracteatus TaxID=296719 RepID=A0A6V7P6V2_ANACO|nr:unnamed protein product [Ananas comosus var. bracteatus]
MAMGMVKCSSITEAVPHPFLRYILRAFCCLGWGDCFDDPNEPTPPPPEEENGHNLLKMFPPFSELSQKGLRSRLQTKDQSTFVSIEVEVGVVEFPYVTGVRRCLDRIAELDFCGTYTARRRESVSREVAQLATSRLTSAKSSSTVRPKLTDFDGV